MEWFVQNLGGNILAVLGAGIAFIVAGIGSSKGVGMAGQAGAGVLTEDPDKFVPVMILEALPSTQAIYGFVIAFLILGKITAGEPLSFGSGMILLLAGLPVGIVGLISAIFQGRVAVAGINMIAKRPEAMVKAIVLATMVEMFAIISLIVSIQIIGRV